MSILGAIHKLRKQAGQASDPLPALMMQAERVAANIIHGAHGQRKAGAGEKFWQFREYQDSDRPQDIDWRQSAKNDHVFIKQREWQATQKTYLWCAQGKSMTFASTKHLKTKQETAQILTLALALLLIKGEENIGIFGNQKTGRGHNRIEDIAHALITDAHIDHELPDHQSFHLPQNAGFIAVGDFLCPLEEIERNFADIATRTKNVAIIQILDPYEIDLEYKGRIQFNGLSTAQNTLINNVSSIRDNYNARMQNHIQSLQNLVHGYGWSYHLHQSNEDLSAALHKISTHINENGGKST